MRIGSISWLSFSMSASIFREKVDCPMNSNLNRVVHTTENGEIGCRMELCKDDGNVGKVKA